MKALALALITGLAATVANAWQEPARGSELRSELLNALRTVVALELNAPIEFVVNDLRHEQGVAFASLLPQRPGGRPIAWANTNMADRGDSQDWYDGYTVHAFLRQIEGHWYVEDYSIGATDVWWHRSALCESYRAVIAEYCR